ncbi:hypothetical protein [Terriglobus roseus]|uniref:Polysaccharide lyase family 4, domain II n=1 Tax=Terriglobus roseus TaxID=392734 RepID=A0A1G7KKD2_9BACT|nr:hypothetical protein [Terriglobus roseus]SDF37652.1 Polysaccharide lyase family 4, domain II [Terriglobus roseus]
MKTLLYAICLWGMLFSARLVTAAEVTARLVQSGNGNGKERIPPAAIWLKPLQGKVDFPPSSNFTLLQKNKMFHPHLLVVPVGSTVSFPNADPFFHNVFSMFDGRRFDLGLYEAGSTRTVAFTREGISYIFCNIHPDMSAVVLSLVTPYYAVADASNNFHIADVPEGDYELHAWVEGRRGEKPPRRIHVSQGSTNLGDIETGQREEPQNHLNKFGKPYDASHPSY